MLLPCLAVVACSLPAAAEDGYDLWLRYRASTPAYQSLDTRCQRTGHRDRAPPTLDAARSRAAARGLAADRRAGFALVDERQQGRRRGFRHAAQFLADRRASAVARARRARRLRDPQRSHQRSGPLPVIAANSDVGVLYGAFHFLRLIQTRQPLTALDIVVAARTQIRVLNHWDNLDRHVERGYAGQSIWDWHKLPGYLDPRYTDYARANASIGINGAVLTNVNANATSLTPAYLAKAAALAGVFRPYGVRVYLTARFSAPIELGGLEDRGSARSGGARLVEGEGRTRSTR